MIRLTTRFLALSTRFLALSTRAPSTSALSTLAVIGVLALGAATPARGQIRLGAPATYALPSTARAVASADFDDDGRDDLVATTADGRAVSLLGGPLDALRPRALFDVGETPDHVLIADLDGDGELDLIVSNRADALLSVLLGNGDGTFADPRIAFAGGPGPAAATAGEFDGDGRLDVIVSLEDTGELALLCGDGTGGFGFITTIWDGATSDARWVASGDFDEDGNLDVATALPDTDEALVLFGDGAGGFAPGAGLPVTSEPAVIEAGDWNGDDHLDLAVGGASAVTVLLGDGAGGFTSSDVPIDEPAADLEAVDFDGDGALDLLALLRDRGAAVFLEGDGSGGFGPGRSLGGSPGALRLTTGDFAGDGVRDFALSGGLTSEALVFRSFVPAQTERTSRTPTGGHLDPLAADFDADGNLDVAVPSSSSVFVHYGDGAGGFGAPIEVALGASGLVDAVAARFDGDDRADFAVLFGEGEVRAYRSTGRGFELAGSFGRDFDATDLVAGSFDDEIDDWTDLAVLYAEAIGVTVFLGDGTGDFTEGATTDAFAAPDSLVAGDFDEDGRLDIAFGTVDGTGTRLAVKFGSGFGTFPESRRFAAVAFTELTTGDIDLDGHADLLLNQANESRIDIRYGAGDGTFARAEALVVLGPIGRPFVVDLDEDGCNELGVVERSRRAVELHRTRPVEPSAPVLRFKLARNATDVLVGDFDGDDHSDLVTVNAFDREIVLARNRTFDSIACRRGNVNAGAGPVTAVVLVNDSAGEGPERVVTLAPSDPIELRVDAPPTRPEGPARFALYAWVGATEDATTRIVDTEDLGLICRPIPLTDASPARLRKIWNNTGVGALGEPDLPSDPAPTVVVSRPAGLGAELRVLLQGVIVDPGAAGASRAAVTNAVEVRTD